MDAHAHAHGKPKPPPPPPPPPPEARKGFMRRMFPFLLAANLFVGVYVLVRTYQKDSGKKDAEADPTAATASTSSTAAAEKSTEPIAAPSKVLPPIPKDEQRQLYKWMLEEKRKIKPRNAAEKKKLDEEKALLKEFIRAESLPNLQGIDIKSRELKTKAIVESGTTDVVFTLDSGGKIILQLQFLLSDEDRKRIQEMRNSAMKRKQQELLGNGYELYFQDGPLSKQLIEKISNIPSQRDQPTLRKSLSLGDLQERALKSSLLHSSGNTSRFEGHIDSKKEHGKTESRSSSVVKKMINAFESSSSQGGLTPITLLWTKMAL